MAYGTPGLDEDEVVSRDELVRVLPPEKDHLLPRSVIKVQEEEISCRPVSKKILAVHYRATPAMDMSMNDDQIVIAVAEGAKYRILKVLKSDAGVVNGELSSVNDFEQDFISIDGMRFLHIRNRISGSGGIVEHDVYTISSQNNLSVIPFAEERKPKLLKADEDLRNGQYQFEGNSFHFVAGIARPEDFECCASGGSYHADLKLRGTFKEDPVKQAFNPDFEFVVVKEWRTQD